MAHRVNCQLVNSNTRDMRLLSNAVAFMSTKVEFARDTERETMAVDVSELLESDALIKERLSAGVSPAQYEWQKLQNDLAALVHVENMRIATMSSSTMPQSARRWWHNVRSAPSMVQSQTSTRVSSEKSKSDGSNRIARQQ